MLLEQIRAREIALHQNAVRHDPAQLQALLHPAFQEFGRSGAVYNRSSMVTALLAETDAPAIWSQDYALEQLADDLALLTYRSARLGKRGQLSRFTLRSSLWQHTPSGWQLRFHQGTPTPRFAKLDGLGGV